MADETKTSGPRGRGIPSKIAGRKALKPSQGSKKLLSADEFFEIKDSKKEFTGPKSTKGSLGDSVNKFRKMDADIKRVQKLSKGGRAGYKGGGMSERGLGRAFMKGGKV